MNTKLLALLFLLPSALTIQSMKIDHSSSFAPTSLKSSDGHGKATQPSPTAMAGRQADKKLSPITLPQIYHHFTDELSKDVTRHIFSLQPGSSEINEDHISCKDHISCLDNARYKAETLRKITEEILEKYGSCYALEWINRNFLHKGISLCETKNYDNTTVLHYIYDIKATELFLQVAGNNTWTLLTMKDNGGYTALHFAACQNKIEIAKLLLNAADDKVQDLMNIRNNKEETAFDIATPEAKEIMQQYLQKNNQ